MGEWREVGAPDSFPILARAGTTCVCFSYWKFPLNKGFHGSKKFENASWRWCSTSWSLAWRRCSIIVCLLPFVCLPVPELGEGAGCALGEELGSRRSSVLSVPSKAGTDDQGNWGWRLRGQESAAAHQQWWGARVCARVHTRRYVMFICISVSLYICVGWSLCVPASVSVHGYVWCVCVKVYVCARVCVPTQHRV